jgi:hypothetical protein
MNMQERKEDVRWPILKIHPGGTWEVHLLSDHWVRLSTHFAGKTVVCPENEDCGLCQLLGSRSHYYLPITFKQTGRMCILELSSQGLMDLEQRIRFAGFQVSPGVILSLCRKTAKSPLRIDVVGCEAVAAMPADHLWVSSVMALYGHEAMRGMECLAGYVERLMPAIVARTELAAADLRAGVNQGIKGRRSS